MDIKRVIPLLCILGVLVWGGIKLKKGFTKLMATDVTTQRVEGGNLSNGLSRGGFAQFLRAPKSMNAEIGLNPVSKECIPYINAIESMDLSALKTPGFNITYQNLTEPAGGCSLTDDLIAASEKEYLSQCFLSNPTKTDIITEACGRSILALRSSMTRSLLKYKKLSDIDSLEKLTDLLYFDVISSMAPDAMPLNLKHLEDIADRMLELNPGIRSARRLKFYVMAQNAIDQGKSKTLKEQDEIWSSLRKDFEDARKSNSLEDGSPEIDALIQTRGFDPSLTLKYSSELLSTNPNNAWAMFLSAYGHWKNDDHEDSFKELKKAAELDPPNPNYPAVLRALSAQGAGEEAFRPGLKYGLTLQDFDK